MIGAGVFLVVFGAFGAFVAMTAPGWRERVGVGLLSVTSVAAGALLLTL